MSDGYSSNLARCAIVDNGRMRGMKSHDCHVFLQSLLPIASFERLWVEAGEAKEVPENGDVEEEDDDSVEEDECQVDQVVSDWDDDN
ncbi:hypothetical protein QL285_028152 [Trifolium repens]|nr:hypothetical protein QL285_028152 [Trifolium repens]